MSKKLILHIGTPKTGTTAIQGYLIANRAQLRKHGYCFPNIKTKWDGVGINRNAHFIESALNQKIGVERGPKSAELVNQAIRELESQTKDFNGAVILSDEAIWQFIARHKEGAKLFKEYGQALGFDEFSIIAYIRRQDLFVESHWKQKVKQKTNVSRTFDDFLKTEYCKAVTDYRTTVNRIESAFGKDSINLRIYDRKLLKDGDAAADFMSLLDLNVASDGFSELLDDKNISIKSNAFAELKRLSALCPSYKKDGSNFLRSPIVKFSEAKGDVVSGGIFSPQERADFLLSFKEGNGDLAQRYFGREELFGPNKVDNLPKWEPADSEFAIDAYLVLVEALAQERAERKQLEKRIKKLESSTKKQAGAAAIRKSLVKFLGRK